VPWRGDGRHLAKPLAERQALSVAPGAQGVVSGNLDIEGMTQAFLDALPKIERVARGEPVGFWHVYRDGQIKAHVALAPAQSSG
jgi:hypothetical protein